MSCDHACDRSTSFTSFGHLCWVFSHVNIGIDDNTLWRLIAGEFFAHGEPDPLTQTAAAGFVWKDLNTCDVLFDCMTWNTISTSDATLCATSYPQRSSTHLALHRVFSVRRLPRWTTHKRKRVPCCHCLCWMHTHVSREGTRPCDMGRRLLDSELLCSPEDFSLRPVRCGRVLAV